VGRWNEAGNVEPGNAEEQPDFKDKQRQQILGKTSGEKDVVTGWTMICPFGLSVDPRMAITAAGMRDESPEHDANSTSQWQLEQTRWLLGTRNPANPNDSRRATRLRSESWVLDDGRLDSLRVGPRGDSTSSIDSYVANEVKQLKSYRSSQPRRRCPLQQNALASCRVSVLTDSEDTNEPKEPDLKSIKRCHLFDSFPNNPAVLALATVV